MLFSIVNRSLEEWPSIKELLRTERRMQYRGLAKCRAGAFVSCGRARDPTSDPCESRVARALEQIARALLLIVARALSCVARALSCVARAHAIQVRARAVRAARVSFGHVPVVRVRHTHCESCGHGRVTLARAWHACVARAQACVSRAHTWVGRRRRGSKSRGRATRAEASRAVAHKRA